MSAQYVVWGAHLPFFFGGGGGAAGKGQKWLNGSFAILPQGWEI